MRRAKSDGIDAELLLRTLLAWLRGEPRVCSMVPIPDQTVIALWRYVTDGGDYQESCVRGRLTIMPG